MKIYGKYLAIAIFFGVLLSMDGTLYFIDMGTKRQLSELASDIGFGNLGGFCLESSTKFMMRLMPFFVYIMIFTTYIYRHFCYSSVYIFSRCEHRKKWFVLESIKLFLFSIAYVIIFVIGRLTPGLLTEGIKYDKTGVVFLIHFIAVMSFWLFQITLLGNILSMAWGSQIGTTTACIMHAASVIFLAFIDEKNLRGIEVMKFKFNIAAHLVTGWHGIKGCDSEFLNLLDYSLNYVETYIYMLIMMVIWIVVGIVFIEKTDIIQQNKETNY